MWWRLFCYAGGGKMSVRDYLKVQQLFEMNKFFTNEDPPSKVVWFFYDDEGKVVRHSFEPADKEWDGAGNKPLIVPLGKDADPTKLAQHWGDYITMAEEMEKRERG